MKVFSRGSTVLPLFLNMSVGVYDGYSFFKVSFKSHMVGHKLGEFVRTRQTFRYGKK
jgi:small subunit ribosomal protein S19